MFMQWQEGAIKGFINSYNGKDLAKDLCAKLHQWEDIQRKMEAIRKDERTWEDRVKAEKHEIHMRRVAVQDACDHIWQYKPDAAGGSDSYSTCYICGKDDFK